MLQADWRAKFDAPNAWYGFVLLEPWCVHSCTPRPDAAMPAAPLTAYGLSHCPRWHCRIGGAPPQMRDAQLTALKLPFVSFGSAVDIGDPTGPWGSVHPRHKQVRPWLQMGGMQTDRWHPA